MCRKAAPCGGAGSCRMRQRSSLPVTAKAPCRWCSMSQGGRIIVPQAVADRGRRARAMRESRVPDACCRAIRFVSTTIPAWRPGHIVSAGRAGRGQPLRRTVRPCAASQASKQCAAGRQTPWGAMGACQGSLSAVAALWWLLFQAPSASPPGARMGSAMAVGPPLAARVTLQPVRASHGSNAGMAGIAGAVGSGWRGPRPSSMPARAAEGGGPRRGHRGRAREAHAARRGRSGARRAGCAHSVPWSRHPAPPRPRVPTALPRIARSRWGFVRSRRGSCSVGEQQSLGVSAGGEVSLG